MFASFMVLVKSFVFFLDTCDVIAYYEEYVFWSVVDEADYIVDKVAELPFPEPVTYVSYRVVDHFFNTALPDMFLSIFKAVLYMVDHAPEYADYSIQAIYSIGSLVRDYVTGFFLW